jgi:hypothetical protein
MPWVLPPADPLAKAKEQAQVVGCPTVSSAALVGCLRGIQPTDLVKNEVGIKAILKATLWKREDTGTKHHAMKMYEGVSKSFRTESITK